MLKTSLELKQFSPSFVQTLLACPRRAWYRLTEEAVDDTVSVAYGRAFHAGAAAHRAGTGNPLEAALASWGSRPGDKTRNPETLRRTLDMYCRIYPKNFEKVEHEFRVKMPNETYLIGYIDGILYHSIYDIKTTSVNISDEFVASRFLSTFKNSFQQLSYFYASNKLGFNITSYVIEAVKVNAKTQKDFSSLSFIPTYKQLKDWERTYVTVTNQFLSGNIYCNQTSCYDYMKECPYFEKCTKDM